MLESYRRYGFGDEHARLLDRREARAMMAADRASRRRVRRRLRGHPPGASCAAWPGWSRACRRSCSRADARPPSSPVACVPITVTCAEVVVRATEGYTARLPALRRTLAPIYSLMIATEPLPARRSGKRRAGRAGRRSATPRHVIIYGQRTVDGRIALRRSRCAVPLRLEHRSRARSRPARFALLKRTLAEFFPDVASAAITHTWGGPLGVPRDWYCSVGFDRETGSAWAGGYVGDGVATTNLAGRTLADLITKTESDLTRLPWVDHRSRRWEPEPLRWLGINGR